jgi:GxxExxY protein
LITKARKGESTRENSETHKVRHRFEDLSKKIIGAAIQACPPPARHRKLRRGGRVHRELGPGFLESIYEKALKIELSKRGLKFDYQREIRIEYLGVEVGTHKLDLLVENTIIVELKAVKELSDIHFAQLRSYLKAANLKVGLLLNFSKPTLEVKRVVSA